MERALIGHIRNNLVLYLVVFFFFLSGIVAGAIAVYFLDQQQVQGLAAYLEDILQQFNGDVPDGYRVLYLSLFNALKEVGAVWFLGLTVIGIPLIIAIIILKGFIVGFTVGFLVQQKAFQGIALSLLAILPPNLILIPSLFIAAVFGISFSISLLRGRHHGEAGILPRLLAYSFLMLVVMLLVTGAGLVEAYLSPALARIVLNYI